MTLRRRPHRELRDAYRFPGFTPSRTIRGIFGDPQARIVTLTRRPKKPSAAPVAGPRVRGTTDSRDGSAIFRVATCAFTSSSTCGGSTAGGAAA